MGAASTDINTAWIAARREPQCCARRSPIIGAARWPLEADSYVVGQVHGGGCGGFPRTGLQPVDRGCCRASPAGWRRGVVPQMGLEAYLWEPCIVFRDHHSGHAIRPWPNSGPLWTGFDS